MVRDRLRTRPGSRGNSGHTRQNAPLESTLADETLNPGPGLGPMVEPTPVRAQEPGKQLRPRPGHRVCNHALVHNHTFDGDGQGDLRQLGKGCNDYGTSRNLVQSHTDRPRAVRYFKHLRIRALAEPPQSRQRRLGSAEGRTQLPHRPDSCLHALHSYCRSHRHSHCWARRAV